MKDYNRAAFWQDTIASTSIVHHLVEHDAFLHPRHLMHACLDACDAQK